MSYLELAGRRFPLVGVILPVHPEREASEWNRSLGFEKSYYSRWFYIPAENGVLFQLEYTNRKRPEDGWTLHLYARTIEENRLDEEPMYLLHPVTLLEQRLIAYPWGEPFGAFYWTNAEEGWLVEHIDRLSRLPYDEPPGLPARLVPLDYFEGESE